MKSIEKWESELAEAGVAPVVKWAEAAALLGLSVKTLRRWRADGRLRALKTAAGGAGRVLVARSEIARILVALAAA